MSRTFLPHVITDDSALGGKVIEKSLRFNGQNESTAPQLRRTGTTTSSSFSIAMWAKLSRVSDQYKMFFSIGQENDANAAWVAVQDGQNMGFQGGNGTYTTITRLFRDPISWFHFLISVNSNNFTVYIDGTSVQTGTIRSLDTSTNGIRIGANYGSYYPWNGYLADVYLIDGQAKAPTDFGYTESQTGIWRPKKYTGTFGTGGAHLEFKDSSSIAALGKDTSGNGNDFTPTTNGFNVTAGAGNDSLIDTPSNNFCTLNAVNQDSNTTITEGNLKAAGSSSTAYANHTHGTIAKSSGRWYYEVEYTANAGGHNSNLPAIGWARTSLRPSDNPTVSGGLCYRPANADYIDLAGNDTSDDKPQTSTGNVIQVAIDLDAGKIWFGNGGTYFESGNPSTGANATLTFTGGAEELTPFVRSLSSTFNFNFGQRAFSYTPPTGFKKLSASDSIPNVPSVVRPERHFEAALWTGNGGTSQDISSLEFQPDLIWFKGRNHGGQNIWIDSVRGVTKNLKSDGNAVEGTTTAFLLSFNPNGFTVGQSGSTNGSSETNVGWCWKAGGAAVSNSDGSITSSVSANQTAGFSIIIYTGTGSAATIGHGLGKTPKLIIVKNRTTQQDWFVNHGMIYNEYGKYYKLSSSGSSNASDTNVFPNTAPTSTVFSVGGDNAVNGSGDNYVAYVWSEIPGFSQFGYWTGNGSTDGTYVHTGFAPKLIIYRKKSDTNWHMLDTVRSPSNPNKLGLDPNLPNAEADDSNLAIDFLSNGFKLRTSHSTANGNDTDYAYYAWAGKPGTTSFGTFANAR